MIDYDSARQIAWAFQSIQEEVFPEGSKNHVAVWKVLDGDLRLTLPPGKYLVENHLSEALDRIRAFDPESFAKSFRALAKAPGQSMFP